MLVGCFSSQWKIHVRDMQLNSTSFWIRSALIPPLQHMVPIAIMWESRASDRSNARICLNHISMLWCNLRCLPGCGKETSGSVSPKEMTILQKDDNPFNRVTDMHLFCIHFVQWGLQRIFTAFWMMKVPPQKSLTVAVGKSMESQSEMFVN